MDAPAYWKTVLRSAVSEATSHYKQKIKQGLALSVLALILQYVLEVRSISDTWKIAISLIASAIIVMGWAFLKSLIFTPVLMHQLERQRADGLSAELNTKAAEMATIHESASRKHPHEEKKEADIRKAFAELSQIQRDAFAWLLDAGETPRGTLAQHHGLDADRLYDTAGFPRLLLYKSVRPGNGTVELNRLYYINPDFKNALQNVLYPD